VSMLMSVLLFPAVVFAQAPASTPSAGLTPESPFYFLDSLAETLQELLTLNTSAKARLQIGFAAERVAEIQKILETKGVEAKGLAVAQARLKSHLADAAAIVTDKRVKGENVRELAKELGDEFGASQAALAQTFDEQKRALEAKKESIEEQLKAARRSKDAALTETLTLQLAQLKEQIKLLNATEKQIDDDLEDDDETIEEAEDEDNSPAELKKEAQQQIGEAEKKRREVEYEMSKEGVQIAPASFNAYNQFLVQAKDLLSKEDYGGAIRAAKEAKASLEEVKQGAEQQREEQKQEEEQVKKEAEKISEAEKKLLEQQREQQKQESEQ
ncbi:MAG: DUF5667 domain-containing protein, partial [Patescibacteria group bacterium]